MEAASSSLAIPMTAELGDLLEACRNWRMGAQRFVVLTCAKADIGNVEVPASDLCRPTRTRRLFSFEEE